MGPNGRLELTRTFGVHTMDSMNPHWWCAACDRVVADPNVYTAGSVTYDDVETLAAASRQVIAVVSFREPPRCACGARPALRAADYHAFHSERAIDLVMRWTPEATAPERLWWDGERYATAITLTDDEAWCVTGDAAIRRAAARIEVEGLEAAIEDILLAQDEVPGDRALLAFVPPLLDGGYLDLARAIVEDLVDSWPDDTNVQAQLGALVAAGA